MNKKTQETLDELLRAELITDISDLTAGGKAGLFFDYMLSRYSHMLQNDMDAVSKCDFDKGETFHKLLIRFGKYLLKNPQVIEDKLALADEENEQSHGNAKIADEPVIFVTNHRFKDDILATLIAAERRTFIAFGSLPKFFCTADGFVSAKNGVILINRKVANGKRASVPKAKYVLKNGMNLLICPEGVWNKKPNACMLDFWNGFYRIAQKEDGTFYPIVPIVHYIADTHRPGKDNPIHTLVDTPILLDGMNERDAIEYVRSRMLTWYWKLMEKYGTATREQALGTYTNATEAWRDELQKRVASAGRYDDEIETAADRRNKNDELLVWEPIARLAISRENIIEVIRAKERAELLRENDFQHCF